jgi:hypothetical protein
MDLLFGLGMVILFVGSGLETLLYFFASPVLARLAFFPMGQSPPFDVGPAGQDVLSGRRTAALATDGLPRESPGYREAPTAPLAVPESIVAHLGIAPKEESDSHFVYGVPSREEIVVRLPFKFFGSRTYGLVRMKLAFDGHKVTVKSTFLPVPSVSYAASSLVFLLSTLGGGMGAEALMFPGVILVALVINGAISWFRLRGPLQMLRMRIEGGVHSLG